MNVQNLRSRCVTAALLTAGLGSVSRAGAATPVTPAASPVETRSSYGEDDRGTRTFGMTLTLGEGMVLASSEVFRAPVTLSLVPSARWPWFSVDLGLSTALESLTIGDTGISGWGFTFFPGAQLAPPMTPFYVRAAIPLQIRAHGFGWGVLFGVGVDVPLTEHLGIVAEVDSTLSSELSFGGDGVLLEFRVGMSLHL